MKTSPPTIVVLNADEVDLAAKIEFDIEPLSPGRHERIRASCEHARPLAKSLLSRGAIPDIRISYFMDPEYNIHGKRSRKEVFEKNGTRGDAILGHPHFLPYLRYFIHGPNLPMSVIEKFCAAVKSDPFEGTELLENLRRLARQAVRKHGLERRDAAEEFYKLSLELGLPDWEARNVRDAVMKIRTR